MKTEKDLKSSAPPRKTIKSLSSKIIDSNGRINYRAVNELYHYKYKRNHNRTGSNMKTIKDALKEEASANRNETLKDILKEDMRYCAAIAKKISNGAVSVLNESQVQGYKAQPRWSPLVEEYAKRFADIQAIKKFLIEEAGEEQAQSGDPATLLMCTLKARYEDIKFYHHNLVGDNWLQDHELLAEFYDELEKDSDAIIEILMQYGCDEPTWPQVIQTVHCVDSVDAVDADYAFYKVRDAFAEIVNLIYAVRNGLQGLSDGAKSELDGIAYKLELEYQYKLDRRLAKVDAMIAQSQGMEGDEDEDDGEDDEGGDEAEGQEGDASEEEAAPEAEAEKPASAVEEAAGDKAKK
jgi:DNA-binding ferritin-like protein